MFKSFNTFKRNLIIKSICFRYKIKDYSINENGTVDVDGDVFLEKMNLKRIPLKFSRVEGDFVCMDNKLTSLEGAPKYLKGNIHLSSNQLTSLEHFPENMFGRLFLYNNPVAEIYYLNPCREFIEMLNEYDVIRDGNKVVESRLRQALEDSINNRYLPDVGCIDFEHYQLI